MKIYLVDKNPEMCIAWEENFNYSDNIYNDTVENFLQNHYEDIDAIIMPGNSEMLMDGSYDLGIVNMLNDNDVRRLRKEKENKFNKIIPVGNCVSIKGDKIIIYIPTMYYPMDILDYSIVFTCTYLGLIEAKKYKVKSILIPAFCAGSGRVPFNIVAKNMNLAYNTFLGKEKNVLNKIIFK